MLSAFQRSRHVDCVDRQERNVLMNQTSRKVAVVQHGGKLPHHRAIAVRTIRRRVILVVELVAILCAAFTLACGVPNATGGAAKDVASSTPALPPQTPPPSNEALLARARPFELDTRYEPPPCDPLEHNTSGYAKTMCSAV